MSQQSGKKFTAKFIRGLKCQKGKQHYEPLLPEFHLYVAVTQAGTKKFVYRRKQKTWSNEKGAYYQAWKMIPLNLKFEDELDDYMNKPAMDLAKAKASEIEARFNREENPFEVETIAAKRLTFQNLFDDYLEKHLQNRGKRVDDICKNFDRWFMNVKNRPVMQFTSADAFTLHSQMKQTPYAANRAIQLGRAIVNHAIKTEILGEGQSNPFAKVTLFKETPRKRFLRDDEAGRLLLEIKTNVPIDHCRERTLADYILLNLLTGVRKTVLLTMEWSEIDWKAKTWTIPSEKMKNDEGQVILLGPEEIECLTQRKAILKKSRIASPWVFPSETSKTGHFVEPKRGWKSLKDRVSLSDVTIHDLRRSLSSAMTNAGASTSVVQAAMNHKDMKTTMKHYSVAAHKAQLEGRMLARQGWFDEAEKQGKAPKSAPSSNVKPFKAKARKSK
jgi:integrase